MITITNGNVTLKVSNSAYKLMYMDCGFYPVGSSPIRESSDMVGMHHSHDLPDLSDSIHPETDEEEYDDEEIDLSEIPLGEMSFDQLNDYADQLEIDHEGIRSKKELRATIKQYLNQ